MSRAPVPEDLIASDLIILLMSAPTRARSATDRINGITRLEKLLFLADKETQVAGKVDRAFQFKPYDYGPYSKEIYEAVELLEEAGLVKEERVFEGQPLDEMEETAGGHYEAEGTERRLLLTNEGRAVANLLAEQHQNVARELSQIKDKYAGMPLRRLIRYVYGTYPEYAEASKIRDQIT